MHRLALSLAALAFALLPTAATGVGVINPAEHYETAVSVAEYMIATEGCEAAFQETYKGRKKRPMLDILDDMYIAVVDIPDAGPGPNTAGATLPPIAPRVIMLDVFWMMVRNPAETAVTIIHEAVHLLDYSYLKKEEWEALSLHEKEVRAEKISERCKRAFFETYPELLVGE